MKFKLSKKEAKEFEENIQFYFPKTDEEAQEGGYAGMKMLNQDAWAYQNYTAEYMILTECARHRATRNLRKKLEELDSRISALEKDNQNSLLQTFYRILCNFWIELQWDICQNPRVYVASIITGIMTYLFFYLT